MLSQLRWFPALTLLAGALTGLPLQAAEAPREQHDGATGFWLRSSELETFVALRPHFRLLAIRVPGQDSLLADGKTAEQGVRLAYMEQEQVKSSFDVGNQPAEVLEEAADHARLLLAPAAGLEYEVEVRLDPNAPLLHLRTLLRNTGPDPRPLSAWTVLAFPRSEGGQILAPFDQTPRSRRRVVLPWWSRWPQETVRFGRDVLVADTGAPMQGAYKVGLISDAGWIAYQNSGKAIVLAAPFDPQATYPEDGANITLFQCHTDRVWCEIEQMSPLEAVGPGQQLTFEQTIRLVEFDPAAPPPTTQPGQNEVDPFRLSLEAAMGPASRPAR